MGDIGRGEVFVGGIERRKKKKKNDFGRTFFSLKCMVSYQPYC